jgi:nicotinamide mononucleotide transporter
MSPIELAATLLGLINVGLIIGRSVWNYPFGLAMVALYTWIFWSARLYSDTLLQVFFFVVQLYGWSNWLGHRGGDGRVVPARLSGAQAIASVVLTALGSALLGWVMARWTDAALPWWDALVAGTSVAGQCLLSWRRVENWLFWIFSDVIAIGVYWVKELDLTAGLYVVFLAMSVAGFVAWRREMRDAAPARALPA